jgi:integration host factor subunit beta
LREGDLWREELPNPTAAKENPAVTKKELVRSISEDLGLTQLQTKNIVQKVFEAILDTLVENGRVELRNFGVFEVKRRSPRRARNPRTGEEVFIPEKYVVTFKPGQVMQQRVRALGNANGNGADTASQKLEAKSQITAVKADGKA